jgi:hypothetical protein
MVNTHDVIPLQAFDMDSHLIHPNDYRSFLQDALVQVHFHLFHYAIKGNNSIDTYTADIFQMRVLDKPKPTNNMSQGKRTFNLVDPLTPNLSPTTFRNFTSGLPEEYVIVTRANSLYLTPCQQ